MPTKTCWICQIPRSNEKVLCPASSSMNDIFFCIMTDVMTSDTMLDKYSASLNTKFMAMTIDGMTVPVPTRNGMMSGTITATHMSDVGLWIPVRFLHTPKTFTTDEAHMMEIQEGIIFNMIHIWDYIDEATRKSLVTAAAGSHTVTKELQPVFHAMCKHSSHILMLNLFYQRGKYISDNTDASTGMSKLADKDVEGLDDCRKEYVVNASMQHRYFMTLFYRRIYGIYSKTNIMEIAEQNKDEALASPFNCPDTYLELLVHLFMLLHRALTWANVPRKSPPFDTRLCDKVLIDFSHMPPSLFEHRSMLLKHEGEFAVHCNHFRLAETVVKKMHIIKILHTCTKGGAVVAKACSNEVPILRHGDMQTHEHLKILLDLLSMSELTPDIEKRLSKFMKDAFPQISMLKRVKDIIRWVAFEIIYQQHVAAIAYVKDTRAPHSTAAQFISMTFGVSADMSEEWKKENAKIKNFIDKCTKWRDSMKIELIDDLINGEKSIQKTAHSLPDVKKTSNILTPSHNSNTDRLHAKNASVPPLLSVITHEETPTSYKLAELIAEVNADWDGLQAEIASVLELGSR